MDNQLPSAENMSVSAIAAMNNVKEVHDYKAPKHYLHTVILICMVIFAVFVVGLSVINFQGFASKQSVKLIHAQTSNTQDVQKLTNQ